MFLFTEHQGSKLVNPFPMEQVLWFIVLSRSPAAATEGRGHWSSLWFLTPTNLMSWLATQRIDIRYSSSLCEEKLAHAITIFSYKSARKITSSAASHSTYLSSSEAWENLLGYDTNPWGREILDPITWILLQCCIVKYTVMNVFPVKPTLSFSFYYLHFMVTSQASLEKRKKVAVDINGSWHQLRFLQRHMNYLDNLINQENPVCWVFQTRALTKNPLICSCFLTTAMNHW